MAAERPDAVPGLQPATLLLVLCGGAVGGAARHGLGVALPAQGATWPWAVVLANVSGAFLLAVLLVLVPALWPEDRRLRPALGTGFCGAFTTMSAVAVGADELARDAGALTAAGFLAVNAVGGLLAVVLGAGLVRALLHRAPP